MVREIGATTRHRRLLEWTPQGRLGILILRWLEFLLVAAALVASGLVSAFVTKPPRHDELLSAIHAVLPVGQGSTHLVSAP